MANEFKVDNGDGIGGMTAAAEHLTLNGGDTQTLSFDDQNITLHVHFLVDTCTKPSLPFYYNSGLNELFLQVFKRTECT